MSRPYHTLQALLGLLVLGPLGCEDTRYSSTATIPTNAPSDIEDSPTLDPECEGDCRPLLAQPGARRLGDDGPFVPNLDIAVYETAQLSSGIDGVAGLAFEWSFVSHPNGVQPRFEPDATQSHPQLELLAQGTYRLQVEIRSADHSAVYPVILQVGIPEGLTIELTWDTPGDPERLTAGVGEGADADLHLVRGDGQWNRAPDDCSYRNKRPDWDQPGVLDDDPSLNIDDRDGWGPEIISLRTPQPGTYKIGVLLHNDWGFGPSTVTVRISIHGEVVAVRSRSEMVTGQLWHLANIRWSRDGDFTIAGGRGILDPP